MEGTIDVRGIPVVGCEVIAPLKIDQARAALLGFRGAETIVSEVHLLDGVDWTRVELRGAPSVKPEIMVQLTLDVISRLVGEAPACEGRVHAYLVGGLARIEVQARPPDHIVPGGGESAA